MSDGKDLQWHPIPTGEGDAIVTECGGIETDVARNRWRFESSEAERKWRDVHGEACPLRVVNSERYDPRLFEDEKLGPSA